MRRENSSPSMARWSDDNMSWGAQVDSRTPSAVTTHEQLRLSACKSSRASVWVPCHSTLVAMNKYLVSRPAASQGGYLGLLRQPACHRHATNKTRTALLKRCDIVTCCRPV